jgi:hypothetical protein
LVPCAVYIVITGGNGHCFSTVINATGKTIVHEEVARVHLIIITKRK